VHHNIQLPFLATPEKGDAIIRRYMDFAKFVSLLDEQALFFVRADKLGDSFEGSHSKANIEIRPQVYRDMLKNLGSNSQDVLKDMSAFFKFLPKITAVSCWHLSEYESDAMWKLYLESSEGIAIQSTYYRLKSSIRDKSLPIHIYKVKYIDYEQDFMPGEFNVGPFFHKRKGFEHEHELRAVIQNWAYERGGEKVLAKPIADEGIYVKVDLDLLIDRIYVAPKCPEWFFKLVKSVVRKYKLNKDVLRSSLDDKPRY